MNNLEIYLHLFHDSKYSWKYDSETNKTFSFEASPPLLSFLQSIEIIPEEIQEKFVFEKYSLPFSFFFDIDEFQQEVRPSDLEKEITIHQYDKDDFLWYDNERKTTSLNGHTPKTDLFLFQNVKSYFILMDFFEKEALKENEIFHFIDHFSKTTRSIVISSLVEKKRIVLKYPQTGVPFVDYSINFFPPTEKFIKLFRSNERYPVFLKNALIKRCNSSTKDNFLVLFQKLPEIIKEAKVNFNVYLHEISLDKIKAEYKEYKQKYYNDQNDILSKISTQILALPLSVAGSAFAINRLQDSNTGIGLVLIGLLIFLIYLSYTLRIYWLDLKGVKSQMLYDYSLIKEQDFFIDNHSELEHFQSIKKDLENRIRMLQNNLKIFSASIWLIHVLLLMYGMNLIFPSLGSTQNIMIFLGGAMIYAALDVYLIFTKEE